MPAHGPSSFSVTLKNVCVDFGPHPVLVDASATFTETSRVAVVGPNGVGKSTLLKVIARSLSPTQGTVVFAPPKTTVGMLDQELQAGPGDAGPDQDHPPTVRDGLLNRTGVLAAESALTRSTQALADGVDGADDAYAEAFERWTDVGAADFDVRLAKVLDELDLPPRVLALQPHQLSGGQAARAGLAAVMLSQFDLTLLDEPTNNLDSAGLHFLEAWAKKHQGGLVIVSHDRAFLERTVTSVLEIDEHHRTVSLFQGGWQAFLDERARARAQAEERYANYVGERGRLQQRAQRQREWVERGVNKAKKHPRDGDKHVRNFNLDQTEQLAAKAAASRRAAEQLESVEKPWEGWDLRFTIDQAPRSASVVAVFDQVVLRRGEWQLGPLDLELRWAERVALVGPNGSGKSSMIAALLGGLTPASGTARLGSGVVVGQLDQERSSFDAGATPLLEVFQEQTGQTVNEARSILAKFGLNAEAVLRPAASVSPGERTRAQLALFQATGVNLLILDEPTNHLDLPAIEQLENALSHYDGTLLLVSHDRRLLDNVHTTRTIHVSRCRR